MKKVFNKRKYIAKLEKENAGLRRANYALAAEVNHLVDKIDRAVNYCEDKIRRKKPTPAWLREVMAHE